MKYIGVVGSRRRNTKADKRAVWEELKRLYEPGDILVSGGCKKGGDEHGRKWAEAHGVPMLTFYANWRMGRHAGFTRNTSIALRSDYLIAQPAANRTGGTEDTIVKFRKKVLQRTTNCIAGRLILI